MKTRLLIIRFSSFGDIVQSLTVPQAFLAQHPDAEIHWVVRKDFEEILSFSPYVHKVWAFDRNRGLRGLLQLAKELRMFPWTHIYDAHNNLRSHLLCWLLKSEYFVRRSKQRIKRFLQFQLGIKQFKMPYYGALSYLEPLKKWGISSSVSQLPPLQQDTLKASQFNLKNPYVTLVPSAAWQMKRWPVEYWQKLILALSDLNIVLLGGPSDLFINDLAKHPHVTNLAGKLSLKESAQVVASSQLVVSGDTGILHVADQMGIPSIALIGPSAFGYPSRSTSQIIEIELSCKPCSKDGRGRCKNSVYQKCLVDITPEQIETRIRQNVRVRT